MAAATLLTGSVVAVAVATGAGSGGEQRTTQTAHPRPQALTLEVQNAEQVRARAVSRSAKRVTLRAKPKVTAHKYRTGNLNLWPAPREKGKPLTVLKEGGKVAVTGVRRAGFAQILYSGQVRWVNAHYLSDKKPAAAGSAGVSSAPCPDGSSTESGLTSSAVTLFRSACHAFPALSSYWGYDGHGEHASGRAIDFMVTDSSLGQALADWARAHASELNLYDVIWAQHIWTPVRSAEGWRSMPDRGSATANHYDHVHISVN
jgi:hypothetical protein